MKSERLFRFGSSLDGESVEEFRYANTFCKEPTNGPERLTIGATQDHLSLIWKLASALTEPFFILLILHASRCDNELARYQSPPLQWQHVNDFLAEFIEFLAFDARLDLWLHSPQSEATCESRIHTCTSTTRNLMMRSAA
jgi:hypothetical protein